MSENQIAKVAGAVCALCLCLLLLSNLGFEDLANTPSNPSSYRWNETQTALVIGASEPDWQLSEIFMQAISSLHWPFFAIMSVFGPSDTPSSEIFANLPSQLNSVPLDPRQFVSTIIINTNPGGRVACTGGRFPYEFFVLFPDGTSILEGQCGSGGALANFLEEISWFLANSRGYPVFEPLDLLTIPTYIGDGQQALNSLTTDGQ